MKALYVIFATIIIATIGFIVYTRYDTKKFVESNQQGPEVLSEEKTSPLVPEDVRPQIVTDKGQPEQDVDVNMSNDTDTNSFSAGQSVDIKSRDTATMSDTHQRSEEELAEWAKELKEIEEFSEIVRERTAGVKAQLKLMNERSKERLYKEANRLNSLSAEEQQVYFNNIRSGKALEEIPSNFFEILRNNVQTAGIPDEITDTFIENFKQMIRESTSEAGVKRHLGELRAHGFEPKF